VELCPKLWHIDCCKCCQHSSMDYYHQFITLSIHLCVHHDGLMMTLLRLIDKCDCYVVSQVTVTFPSDPPQPQQRAFWWWSWAWSTTRSWPKWTLLVADLTESVMQSAAEKLLWKHWLVQQLCILSLCHQTQNSTARSVNSLHSLRVNLMSLFSNGKSKLVDGMTFTLQVIKNLPNYSDLNSALSCIHSVYFPLLVLSVNTYCDSEK